MAITDIDNIDKIEGATDGTPIGNVGDRLKVIGAPNPSSYILFEQFKDGNGLEEMNINGSITPVDFTIGADATKDKYITHIDLYTVVNEDVALSVNKFLNINVLTNGIALNFKTSDNVHIPMPNIKRTEHLLSHFAHGNEYIWEEEANFTFIKVSMDLSSHPIVIKSQAEGYVTDDYLKATIQDDLSNSNINEIEMSVKGYYL